MIGAIHRGDGRAIVSHTPLTPKQTIYGAASDVDVHEISKSRVEVSIGLFNKHNPTARACLLFGTPLCYTNEVSKT